MATTASEIILAGYGKSVKNKPGEIATEGTALIRLLNRKLRKYFAFIARENWTMVGDIVLVSFDAGLGGWPRPDNAEMIVEIDNDVEEVVVVPAEDRGAESSKPALYRFGGLFRSAGNPNDPVDGDLNFIIARQPATLAATTDTLDVLWPESFNELLELEVGKFLASKDGRRDETQDLEGEITEWLQLLKERCEHDVINERRRFNITNRFQTSVQRPIGPASAQ
jgi:hypothetical protein